MSKYLQKSLILICLSLLLGAVAVYAQLDQLHGDQTYSTYGVHSGNQVRTSFWNDGQIGYRNPDTQEQVRGEWPINSGHMYIAKISSYFASDVLCEDGIKRPIASESNGTRAGQPTEHSSGDASEDGEYWSMTPLPGFYNENPPADAADQAWIAMSHKDWSWPHLWPDKMDDANDPGWNGFWNGYFGKNADKTADQESYYMIDDYHNKEFPFYPDENNRNRRGLGLRVSVRGMQWNQALVEDCIFWLYSAENIGTHLHDKMGFGINCGPDIGGSGDGSDDGGSYDLATDLAYQYDEDLYGNDGYYPVGLLGLAFLETPGNPHDGIDNDGDGAAYGGPVLTTDMFTSKTVNEGDDVIVINYETFERTKTTMPAAGITINYLGLDYTFPPGDLEEIPQNLIDDNLDGLIDENNGRLVGTGDAAVHVFLNDGLKYINYFTDEGKENPMIDERRDDGIDNNNDWIAATDDVGMDGLADTGDEGEGDGIPTSGFGTDRPGEPNIDKTDIDESDQIGLTSFVLFAVQDPYSLHDDEKLWSALEPGRLDPTFGIGNTDIMMGCAYWPLKPAEIKQLSFALIFGAYTPGDLIGDLVRNKAGAQAAYNANYQFAKAPPTPEVSFIAEDSKVTLYWDNVAELANDPLTGKDFEGYKVYRSTDPAWLDMAIITDGYGVQTSARKPVAQFDLANGKTGFTQTSYEGVEYYLGNDSGIAHSWVDTTVVNGQEYYYAVCSYDHGSDSLSVYPAECSRYLAINADGTYDKDKNVVIVRPEAPAAGFVDASVEKTWKAGSSTNGNVVIPMLDKSLVQDKTYNIVFEDTLVKSSFWFYPNTTAWSLIDITGGASDTLVNKSRVFEEIVTIPDFASFQLMLQNKAELAVNVDSTAWTSDESIHGITFKAAFAFINGQRVVGELRSADYMVVIGEDNSNTSYPLLGADALPCNFRIYNTSENTEVDFYFEERDGDDGKFSAFDVNRTRSDRAFLIEKNADDSLIVTYSFELNNTNSDSLTRNPVAGDTAYVKFDKPFLSHDVLEFSTYAAKTDNEQAKTDLENIKVVPNPYIVTNSWEPENPYSSGRGPRELHFTHLPMECTIRIFSIQGQLIRTLEHSSTQWDGTEIWDMLSKDRLDIAYGVYIYHVEAPGIGEKVGKFAIIK